MASAFSFGFAGDDIDVDENDMSGVEGTEMSNAAQSSPQVTGSLIEPQKHDMAEWVATLPSQISYNKLVINTSHGGRERTFFTLARREVFDIRTQLMAEDGADHENEELILGLEKGDIKPTFYEGGFKTWECALDLAKLVVSEDLPHQTEDQHIIELGAGTAVPSLILFAQALSRPEPAKSRIHFTLADYNSAVLRLVTLPNLLLTWNQLVKHRETSSPEGTPCDEQPDEEELDITPELVESFQKDLAARNITLEFISGAWSPAFVDLVFSSYGEGKGKTLILASETIYSPASLAAFSETLIALLRRSGNEQARSKSLIAAKKVYFGVGGGVDEFVSVLRGLNGSDLDVEEQVDIDSEGVGRVILKIECKST
ncbi:protein-histidine N-methyltransferase [Aspergillus clavatus NRRL 1]|uniref:protein-histidine N-methyltransferase n=1 Tax=Aspergillus clavatus (strain ATCC 1007 / CBS 513.65 / DSM 816 / NCTC 3887 / NRRL 1 / QM 1276 / 107) TaxID=344612 RepID=A1C3X2_ASPCL|nr:uncharacterized protein ACLA_057680 [Aspergillus clavatus NRRL 1]EAW15112.1 conserved hypothetical protein [Aspergillus clavatus NRRL 1]